MSQGIERRPMGLDLSPSSLARRVRELPSGVWAAAVVTVALAASYGPSLRNLREAWDSDPAYTHGYLVAPIAALIAWQRRDRLAGVKIRPNLLGWLALLAILAVRWPLFERNEMWMEESTIPLAVGALLLAFGGWGLLRWAAPAV